MRISDPLKKFGIKSLVSAFSYRTDGNMSLSLGDTADSLENRRKFLSRIGVDYRQLITAKQAHGKEVRYVAEENKASGALDYEDSIQDTDGFITDRKGVPMAILTADCLSVFIYDPVNRAIGLLHAGWRGTEQDISSVGVRAMNGKFGSRPADLMVGFGPSIRSCCFEVDKDFKSNFSFGLVEREGRVFMDIAGINLRQLISCGVKKENIFDPELCTFCGDDFFSFRKEAASAGRIISVMMLE